MYISNFSAIMLELDDAKTPLHDHMKKNFFLQGIQDPSLDSAKSMLILDASKSSNECVSKLREYCLVTEDESHMESKYKSTRVIAAETNTTRMDDSTPDGLPRLPNKLWNELPIEHARFG